MSVCVCVGGGDRISWLIISDAMMHRDKLVDDARAILGDIPLDAASRRVPRAFGEYEELEFSFTACHRSSRRLVHRILHRYACIGNWGLVESVDVLFPVAPDYEDIDLIFVDVAGPAKVRPAR